MQGLDAFEPASGVPTRDPRLLFRGPPRRQLGVDTFERVARPPVALSPAATGEGAFLASPDDLPVLDDAASGAGSPGPDDFMPSLDDIAGLVGPEGPEAPVAPAIAAPVSEAGPAPDASGAATRTAGEVAVTTAAVASALFGASPPEDGAAVGAIAKRTSLVAAALFGSAAPGDASSTAAEVAVRAAALARALFPPGGPPGSPPPEPLAAAPTPSPSAPTPSS